MGLGRAYSVAVRGVDGVIVEIEADITSGLPSVNLVGLPDTALQESRDRVRAAITNCGNEWPMSRLTLALSPATLRKVGSVYDLALAAAVLSAHTKTAWARLEKSVLLGELALDGRVRPIHGVLPAVLAAKQEGWPTVVVPVDNLAEASLIDGIEVCGAGTLRQLQAWLDGKGDLQARVAATGRAPEPMADLADVVGQAQARYAVEVAAAGAHHLMFTGPPGIGKTMLAQRLPGLLPPLSPAESLEVTAVHSVAGLLAGDTPLITRPPFVAPHHTSSVAALVGGGSGFARPGAVSRAHRGVLFLDEFPEMGSSALEALRTPLEDGEIRLARRDGVAWLSGPVPIGPGPASLVDRRVGLYAGGAVRDTRRRTCCWEMPRWTIAWAVASRTRDGCVQADVAGRLGGQVGTQSATRTMSAGSLPRWPARISAVPPKSRGAPDLVEKL